MTSDNTDAAVTQTTSQRELHNGKVRTIKSWIRHQYERVGTLLFGDRIGYTLFLGTLCFAMLTWRAELFITDNATLVRTLEAVSEGRFWIERTTGDSWFNAPGAEVRDGRVYGRNYGQIFISLPVFWVLKVVDALANLRIAFVAFWHLTALAFIVQLGRVYKRLHSFAIGGSVVILLLFVANLALATEFPSPQLELFALQLTTLIAAGLATVFLYRLITHQYSRDLGVMVGIAGGIVLPVSFWALIPKRHVFSVLVCLLVLYLFALSRKPQREITIPGLGPMPVLRAGAYAPVGFLTWIHAAEGLFVFLVLVIADLVTAPKNDLKSLAFVFCIFGLSLLPTVLTNFMVTGSPVEPPRTLGGGSLTKPAAETATETETQDGTGIISQLLEPITDFILISTIIWLISAIGDIALDSLVQLGNLERLNNIFIRSAGGIIRGGNLDFAGANLSVLESAPVLGALLAGAIAWISRLFEAPRAVLRDSNPTAWLAGGLIVAYLLIYVSRLPLHIQINQRYILPIFPLALYILATTDPIQSITTRAKRELMWSYAAGVLFGTQLFMAYIISQEYAIAEAAQANAKLSLVLAAVLALATSLFAITDQYERPAAIAIGLSCAAGTILLLVSGLHYFAVAGEFVLPVIEELSRRL